MSIGRQTAGECDLDQDGSTENEEQLNLRCILEVETTRLSDGFGWGQETGGKGEIKDDTLNVQLEQLNGKSEIKEAGRRTVLGVLNLAKFKLSRKVVRFWEEISVGNINLGIFNMQMAFNLKSWVQMRTPRRTQKRAWCCVLKNPSIQSLSRGTIQRCYCGSQRRPGERLVQWLRLHTFNAGGACLIPGQGTRSHIL